MERMKRKRSRTGGLEGFSGSGGNRSGLVLASVSVSVSVIVMDDVVVIVVVVGFVM